MEIRGNFRLQQLEFSLNCVCNLRIFEYLSIVFWGMNQNMSIKLIGQRIQRLPDSKSQLFEDEVITSKFCEELQACVCLPSYRVPALVCPTT